MNLHVFVCIHCSLGLLQQKISMCFCSMYPMCAVVLRQGFQAACSIVMTNGGASFIQAGSAAVQVTKRSFKRFLVDTPLVSMRLEDCCAPGECPPGGFGTFHQQYWLDGAPVCFLSSALYACRTLYYAGLLSRGYTVVELHKRKDIPREQDDSESAWVLQRKLLESDTAGKPVRLMVKSEKVCKSYQR